MGTVSCLASMSWIWYSVERGNHCRSDEKQPSTPVFLGFPGDSGVKNPPARQETLVQSLGWEDPLEEGMATHSSILAWRIAMDEGAWRSAESMGLQRGGHD